MKIHDLKPAEGSKKTKKRVGRGIGGKGGKTAGRGTKGQKARSKVPGDFEGGQLRLVQRIPKLKGFKNPFRVEYEAANLDVISSVDGNVVTPETLRAKGLVPKKGLIKVLGKGTVDRALTVHAHAFSKSAEAAILAAGGSIEVLPKPFGGPRPAASGNQHMNR